MSTCTFFIHGLHGSSEGTKARFFKTECPFMDVNDFRGSLSERMEKLEQMTASAAAVILVGSSYGGLMGAIYAIQHPEKVKKLVLLAPALSMPDFTVWTHMVTPVPTTIFHGKQDRIVPLEPVRLIAEQCFSDLTFFAVEDDHFLSKTFDTIDWKALLGHDPLNEN